MTQKQFDPRTVRLRDEPIGYARHFRSAGMRRKHERGEIPLDEATKLVPVYRGIGASTRQHLMAAVKYAEKRRLREQE